MARSSLQDRRLVRLFDTAIQMPYSIYSVAYPETRRQDPMIHRFSRWIHQESAQQGVSPETPASTQL
ncbi:hypothetical protein [Granulosicoccus sp. 3-233]|uniref:hypothetical protein n=1 Tax=Granulosicoccus sp. 3-233 TaxID=3417969 RepID=UPI003D32D3C3